MKFNVFIVICLILALILCAIYCKEYIAYFLKLLKGEIKHNKDLNNLKSKNKKTKILSSDEVKKYVNYSVESLKGLEYKLDRVYKLDSLLYQRLKYTKMDDKSVTELFKSICEFLKINYEEIEFKIIRTSSRTKSNIAGSYYSEKQAVNLEISTYTTIEQVVAVIAHECTHHIFNSNGLEMKIVKENEILTDVSAIILGFFEFFYKGYRDEARVAFEGEFKKVVFRNKLGYIGYKDVKRVKRYARKII